MVCPIGSGKMAVMARLLAAASVSQKIAEEVGHQKLAAQYIYRELREADEANLLDEEDMHVFGQMPMTDPLHLVCCNACKKPVKASQYAAHAELCSFLNSAEEMKSAHDGGVGHRKPPRKARKKLLTAYSNQATFVGEQEGSESIDADDANASEAQLDGQPGIPSSPMDTKRNSVCVDVVSILDGKGASSENKFPSASIIPPPTKRSKLISSEHHSLSDDPLTASCLTKSTTTQETFTCRDFQIKSTLGCEIPNDCIASEYPQQVHEHYLLKDTPVPLAAKIYYSQRDNRLRSAIAHLYHVTSAKGLCSNVVSPELSPNSIMQLQALSRRDTSHGQEDDMLSKKREHSAHDKILAQGSEFCFDKSGGCVPVTDFSNQFPAGNILRPQTAPVRFPRSKYIPKPNSFDNDLDSTGKSHGTVQQENGRVPVM